MLTIGEPIKPNTGRPFTTISPPDGAGADLFYERIAGNYALMSMNFTPKDLLLLMFASPEILEFGGGITSVSETENITNSRSFLLNIVNNVINRVLLASDDDFLYRDEVYVSNVLRRIGITDVNHFLREASAVLDESRTMFRLAEHYSRSAGVLREWAERADGKTPVAPAAGMEAAGDGAAAATQPEQGAALFSEIFHRTHADRIFSVLQSYGAYERGERVSDALELNASEWFGVWNAVNLFDNRKGVSVSEFSPVLRHYNAYETGVPPRSETGVPDAMGSAAAAALINIAQNALLSRIARAANTDVRVRVDVSHIFPLASAPTLERFRAWHTERTGSVYAESVFERRLSVLDKLEERLLERMGEGQIAPAPAALTLREDATPEEVGREARAAAESASFRDQSRERSLLHRLRQERSNIERLMKLAGSPGGRDVFRQFIERANISDTASPELKMIAGFEGPRGRRASGEGDGGAGYPEERDIGALISEVIERSAAELTGIVSAGFADTNRYAGLHTEWLMEAGIIEEKEAEETLPGDKLKADLDEYDRRNKEIAKQVAERASAARREKAAEEPRTPISGKRAALEALTGLDDTEKLLKELRASGTQTEGGRRAPELTFLLSSLPEGRREIYERLLAGDRQSAPGEDGAIRSVSLSELNGQIAAATRDAVGTEIRRLEREVRGGADLLNDRIERTIERTERARRGEQAGARGGLRETLRLLHRQETPQSLPEGMTARAGDTERTNREVAVRDIVTREDRIDTEINRVVRETEARSIRDIDAAIGRALAGRMRAMESRIYSGVERKLDIERSRRGK